MSSTQRSIDAGVALGEIFLEKYRVDAILGHGGMGVVALCTHLALNERVAIKMLRRDVLDDADAVQRFMREAQAASKLKSEFVARVTDVGRSATDVPYMVMEYLEGHDLGELIAQRGSIGMPWAVELTLQACEALAEAHSIGIVHRDIKPTNLFVTWRPDGSPLVKVLDFGISKALTGSGLELTQTQSLLGTPAYMSPEQMRSARQVDARSDIWSLGTVLYELLEGRRPFEAESFSEMCIKVAVEPPRPMMRTPLALQQVVLRCLAKAPEQRYASMADLGGDLVPFAHDPHQAQVLAERMSRTLRRGQLAEREPVNPAAVPQLRSAERIAAVVSEPATPPRRLSQIIAAAGPPSDTIAVQRGPKRGLFLAVAVTALATLAVVLSFTRDAAPPVVSAPPAAAAPVAPHAPAAVPQKPVDTAPAASPASSAPSDQSAPTPPAALASEPAPLHDPEIEMEEDDVAVGSRDTRAAPEPGRRNRARSRDDLVTPPLRTPRGRVRRPARPERAPAPTEKCDVFGDAHGRGCGKPDAGVREN